MDAAAEWYARACTLLEGHAGEAPRPRPSPSPDQLKRVGLMRYRYGWGDPAAELRDLTPLALRKESW